MNGWWPRRRKRYSMERLRFLYADLLQHIDVTNEELGPRRAMLECESSHLNSSGNGSNNDNKYSNYRWGHALIWNQYLWRRSVFSIQNDPNDASEDYDDNDNPQQSSSSLKKRKRAELAIAFRVLSATRSADKEGDNFGAIAVRNDATVAALAIARSIEAKVVSLIASIGDIVIQSDRHLSHPTNSIGAVGTTKLGFLRSDAVFEYFCEKAIFSLLIEMAKEKPTVHNGAYGHARHYGTTSCFHGVVWSPLVKAQVLQTVSTLVSSVRDMSALYYLLSNNYINELILSFLPTTQWTDPALVKIMPVYVQLLRNLTLQFAGSPTHLFPFLILNNGQTEQSTSPPLPPSSSSSSSFPLLTAALDVAVSSYAQSDSFVHLTCLHVIVNLLQIPQSPVRNWIARHTELEQKKLATHLSQRLLDRYHRIVNLCSGPVVDAIRSSSIVGQLKDLSDQLNFLNLLFSCDVLCLSVRVCETLLQRLVAVLLHHLLAKERHFLIVGVMDGDVIPQREALAQVSTVVLAQMMAKFEYTPLLRMLAVAVFHPLSPSPKVWHLCKEGGTVLEEKYFLTPALNEVVKAGGTNANELIRNPFREEVMRALTGDLGEWRFVAAAVLVESALDCDALDTETLASLEIVPNGFRIKEYCASSLEISLEKFLERGHRRLSAVSIVSLECAGSLALSFISKLATTMVSVDLYRSPVVKGLWKARNFFNAKSLEFSIQAGVSEIFIELVESAVSSRFQEVYDHHYHKYAIAGSLRAGKTYAYHLNRYGCRQAMAPKSGILIRKLKGVSSNDVESARFYIQMALHFRSLCRVVEDMVNSWHHQHHCDDDERPFGGTAELDEADDLILGIGGLKPRPTVGMDLDLRGRMTFCILASANDTLTLHADNMDLSLSQNGAFRPSSHHLVLVLDPTDILVVQPMNRSEVNRGTVVCSISLRSVIAFASDGEWLHLAIRNVPDVGNLIKNGNMALRFENVGTCLIVRQYVEQAKKLLRLKLMDQIHALFRISWPLGCHDENTSSSDAQPQPVKPQKKSKQVEQSTFAQKDSSMDCEIVEAPPVNQSKDDLTNPALNSSLDEDASSNQQGEDAATQQPAQESQHSLGGESPAHEERDRANQYNDEIRPTFAEEEEAPCQP